MWSTWLLKSRSDLRQRWLQVAVLAIVLVAGTAALTLAFTVDRSTLQVFDQVHEEANGAHIWLSGDDTDLAAAAQRPGVEQASEVLVSLGASLVFEGEAHAAVAWGIGETPEVATGLLREGRWVSPDRDDEVVIGSGLARAAGIELGERLLLVAPNSRSASYEVVGIVTPTFRVPYPQLTPAGAFVSRTAIEGLAGGELTTLSDSDRALLGIETSLGVRLGDATPLDEFVAGLDGALAAVTWQDTRAGVIDETRGPSTMLRIFSIFAVLALSFVVAATIANHAVAQKREIGLLKAVGITPRQTTAMLIGQMLAISVPAALLGIAIGIVATSSFQWSITRLLDSSAVTSFSLPALIGVFIAVQVLVIVCALLPAVRAGRTRIVDAIASSPRQTAGSASLVARAANAMRLPQVVVVGVKDIFSRPLRSWLTIAAISVAVATLMMTVSLRHSLQLIVDEPALIGSSPYELQATPLGELTAVRAADPGIPAEVVSHEQAADIISSHPSVEAFITDFASEATIEGVPVVNHAGEGDVEAMNFLFLEGRAVAAADEVMVGAGLAQQLDLSVGDALPVEVMPGNPVTMTIVGIYFADQNEGVELMYQLDALRALEPAAGPGGFDIRLVPGADPEAVIADLAASAGGGLAVTNLTRETDANIADGRELITPMTLLGAGLALLAAANLLSSLVFSVRERTAEFGIMKSIGFTPRQVVGVVLTGVAPLALIGTLVGVPVGYYLLDWVFRSQSEAHQPTSIIEWPPVVWLAALVVVALAMTFAGSFMPARKAGRLGVAEALRAE